MATYPFTNASDIEFIVSPSSGEIVVKVGTSEFKVHENSGTRRWSVIKNSGVKYFKEVAGTAIDSTDWPIFCMPFSSNPHSCPLSLVSFSNVDHTYAIIGTDDIRNYGDGVCRDAFWDIYNPSTSSTKFLEVMVIKIGGLYEARFRHSHHGSPNPPGSCGTLGSTIYVCVNPHA